MAYLTAVLLAVVPAFGAGALTGTITTSAAGGGQPVGAAQVKVLGGNKGLGVAKSAADGAFAVAGIKPGTYTLLISNERFLDAVVSSCCPITSRAAISWWPEASFAPVSRPSVGRPSRT